jgi:uncharacterized membrane protein
LVRKKEVSLFNPTGSQWEWEAEIRTDENNLARWYAKFRGSATFLWGLCGFVLFWLIVIHGFLGYDKDFGIINLLLSSEASISLAFFAMMQEQTDMHHAELMLAIKDMLEQSNKVDAEILETVEDIEEKIDVN